MKHGTCKHCGAVNYGLDQDRYRDALESICAISNMADISAAKFRARDALNHEPEMKEVRVARWMFYKEGGELHSGYTSKEAAELWYDTLTDEAQKSLALVEMTGTFLRPIRQRRMELKMEDDLKHFGQYIALNSPDTPKQGVRIFAEWQE